MAYHDSLVLYDSKEAWSKYKAFVIKYESCTREELHAIVAELDKDGRDNSPEESIKLRAVWRILAEREHYEQQFLDYWQTEDKKKEQLRTRMRDVRGHKLGYIQGFIDYFYGIIAANLTPEQKLFSAKARVVMDQKIEQHRAYEQHKELVRAGEKMKAPDMEQEIEELFYAYLEWSLDDLDAKIAGMTQTPFSEFTDEQWVQFKVADELFRYNLIVREFELRPMGWVQRFIDSYDHVKTEDITHNEALYLSCAYTALKNLRLQGHMDRHEAEMEEMFELFDDLNIYM